MTAEDDASIRSTKLDNDSVSIGGASSMTFHSTSGTDNDTNRYLDIGPVSYGLEIVPTVACSLTEINGRTLKAAISIPVLGYITNNLKLSSIKITAGSATVVEVTMKGGN